MNPRADSHFNSSYEEKMLVMLKKFWSPSQKWYGDNLEINNNPKFQDN